MRIPTRPADDVRRIETLRAYRLLDTLPEQALDDLTALAAHICGVPIALISLVDEQRQWFKSKLGWPAGQMDRDISFCAHAILQPDLFIVPDTTNDERFADNPLVVGEPHIRFYAGAPLIAPDGQALGTLCIMDRVPRELSPIQKESLQVLSRQVMAQLELHRQTRTLKESEAKFSAAFHTSSVMFGITTEDGKFVEVNPAFCSLTGLSRAELIGQTLVGLGLLTATDREQLVAAVRRHGGSLRDAELTLHLRDGRVRHLLYSIEEILIQGVLHRLGTGFDITERKQAQAAQRQSLDRFEAITRATNDVVWDWDVTTNVLWWNQNLLSLFGYRPEHIHPGLEGWSNHIHPEDRDHVLSSLRAVMDGGQKVWSEEYRFRRRDGSYTNVLDRGDVLRDEAGRAVRMIGAMQDISARKEAEQRLVRLNRTHAVLSDINQLMVRQREPNTILEGACRIAVETGGFLMAWVGLQEQADTPLTVSAHAGAAPDTVELLKRILGGPPPNCAITHQALAQGHHMMSNSLAQDPMAATWREAALERGFRAMVSLPLTVSGRRVGVFNLYADQENFFDAEELRLLDDLVMDIAFALEGCEREHARQIAQEQLRDSEERFRELAENINEVFWITDPSKSRILFVSAAYEKIWGRSRESVYASPTSWIDSVHADDRARIIQAIHTRQVQGIYDETYRIIRPDGTERWIHDQAFPIRSQAGEVLRIVGIAEDITNSRKLEEQLRQSQKMDAIGQLAGGVAHDFNNILTVMVMQVELLRANERLDPELAAGLQMIRASAERAANLTRQLLLFSHKQMMQARNVNLNEVVSSLAKMLPRLIEENVKLELNLYPRPLLTHADAGMLDQVIINLAVNARDAMPKGGRLLIETTEKTVDEALARRHPDAAVGRYVGIKVTDTGTGIAPEVLPHIFEPFFTTKAQGKGTGLGLATVFGIVQQHHGWTTVTSKLGRGTTFEIYLPSCQPKATDAESSAKTKVQRGTETILLVEDELAVRQLTRIVLERSGYRVLEAADGREARRIWAEHRSEIDLLFTDMVMPGGVSGSDLAAGLQADKPNLRVIFSSGYSADIARGNLALEKGYNFIQKPSSPERLVETVRRCLDRGMK